MVTTPHQLSCVLWGRSLNMADVVENPLPNSPYRELTRQLRQGDEVQRVYKI